MPYILDLQPDGSYKVCKKDKSKCFSKKGIPKKRAVKQLKAIGISEARMKGGQLSAEELISQYLDKNGSWNGDLKAWQDANFPGCGPGNAYDPNGGCYENCYENQEPFSCIATDTQKQRVGEINKYKDKAPVRTAIQDDDAMKRFLAVEIRKEDEEKAKKEVTSSYDIPKVPKWEDIREVKDWNELPSGYTGFAKMVTSSEGYDPKNPMTYNIAYIKDGKFVINRLKPNSELKYKFDWDKVKQRWEKLQSYNPFNPANFATDRKNKVTKDAINGKFINFDSLGREKFDANYHGSVEYLNSVEGRHIREADPYFEELYLKLLEQMHGWEGRSEEEKKKFEDDLQKDFEKQEKERYGDNKDIFSPEANFTLTNRKGEKLRVNKVRLRKDGGYDIQFANGTWEYQPGKDEWDCNEWKRGERLEDYGVCGTKGRQEASQLKERNINRERDQIWDGMSGWDKFVNGLAVAGAYTTDNIMPIASTVLSFVPGIGSTLSTIIDTAKNANDTILNLMGNPCRHFNECTARDVEAGKANSLYHRTKGDTVAEQYLTDENWQKLLDNNEEVHPLIMDTVNYGSRAGKFVQTGEGKGKNRVKKMKKMKGGKMAYTANQQRLIDLEKTQEGKEKRMKQFDDYNKQFERTDYLQRHVFGHLSLNDIMGVYNTKEEQDAFMKFLEDGVKLEGEDKFFYHNQPAITNLKDVYSKSGSPATQARFNFPTGGWDITYADGSVEHTLGIRNKEFFDPLNRNVQEYVSNMAVPLAEQNLKRLEKQEQDRKDRMSSSDKFFEGLNDTLTNIADIGAEFLPINKLITETYKTFRPETSSERSQNWINENQTKYEDMLLNAKTLGEENAELFLGRLKGLAQYDPNIQEDIKKLQSGTTLQRALSGNGKKSNVVNEKLYEKIKNEVYKKYPKHSLYRSALIQKIYQSEGGKYKKGKEPKMNIKKWFKQDWISLNDWLRGEKVQCGNSDTEKKYNEYPLCRPLKIAESMSSKEIKKLIDKKNKLKSKPVITKKVLGTEKFNIKPTITGMGKGIKMFELFKGTGSVGNVAKKLGFDVVSLDFDPIYTPDIETDILKWDYKKWAENNNFYPSYIWASPPCNTFSTLAYPLKERNTKTAKPKSDRAKEGTKILHKTLEIIDYFKSKNPDLLYTIENPRAMMRHDEKMLKLPNRETTLYCLYGDFKRKPTDFWSNFKMNLDTETKQCKNKTINVARINNIKQRYSIPSRLIKKILNSALSVFKGSKVGSGQNKFMNQLNNLNISPDKYLKIVKSTAKQAGYNPKLLKFSSKPNKKLEYDGVDFGAVGYGDFIIYKLTNNKIANKKRDDYRKRAEKVMKETNNKISPASLSYYILW